MRKLATIRKIDNIRPIVDADAIEAAVVGGWTVVVKKDEFKVGDLAVYLEIDSWVPHELAPFLSKGDGPSVFNDIRGERLRTVKLRGQVSQGLLFPVHNDSTGTYLMIYNDEHGEYSLTVAEGDDVSDALNIIKYEPPVPAQLAGDVRGMFPTKIPKTDQERIQNLTVELEEWKAEALSWEVTEKLDGTSMTVYVDGDDEGVCSRNLNLKENEANSLWRVAKHDQLIEKLRSTGRNLAVQGELVGEGIQKNMYKLKGQHFFLFDVYDIDRGAYLNPVERRALASKLDIGHVPVLKEDEVLEVCNVEHILKWAEAKALMGGAEREGIVFKCNEREVSFKAISNKFLLKGGE
jgi:RNA ligase (TIGR02306 family)